MNSLTLETANGADPGSEFRRLQQKLADMYRRVFPDRLAQRTVVVVPSLTMDPDELAQFDLRPVISPAAFLTHVNTTVNTTCETVLPSPFRMASCFD